MMFARAAEQVEELESPGSYAFDVPNQKFQIP